jgi:lysylphosphatidylglycerol synthetase-like protein (DUF2156 family)
MGPGGRLIRVYVGLAVAGAIFPFLIVLPWAAEFGFSPGLFLLQVFATKPSTAFAADVIYSAAVFVLFTIVEGRRLGMRGLWIPALLVLTVGLCCALPTFLAMRERALAARL